jgi:uncharacterized pyridoxamine 5'-phosphate oxidase family protein
MKASQLRGGDKIRIISLPLGCGSPDYFMHSDAKRIFKRLMHRKRPVRISEITKDGPWYRCRFRMKNGTREYHSLVVAEDDRNWVPVQKRAS